MIPILEPMRGVGSGAAGSARWLWRHIDSLAVRALRRWLGSVLTRLFKLLVFASIALAAGAGSALYMVDVGVAPIAVQAGPWRSWPGLGVPHADPYSRAHLARSGELPLAAPYGATWLASRDAAGEQLYADCEYEIAGPAPEAQWWSLAVYDRAGNLMENVADLHALAGPQIVRQPDGSILVRMASEARSGNWLPLPEEGAIVVALHLYGPADSSGLGVVGEGPRLPTISMVTCR